MGASDSQAADSHYLSLEIADILCGGFVLEYNFFHGDVSLEIGIAWVVNSRRLFALYNVWDAVTLLFYDIFLN